MAVSVRICCPHTGNTGETSLKVVPRVESDVQATSKRDSHRVACRVVQDRLHAVYTLYLVAFPGFIKHVIGKDYLCEQMLATLHSLQFFAHATSNTV